MCENITKASNILICSFSKCLINWFQMNLHICYFKMNCFRCTCERKFPSVCFPIYSFWKTSGLKSNKYIINEANNNPKVRTRCVKRIAIQFQYPQTLLFGEHYAKQVCKLSMSNKISQKKTIFSIDYNFS